MLDLGHQLLELLTAVVAALIGVIVVRQRRRLAALGLLNPRGSGWKSR